MSDIGQSERATQNRVIALFREVLGYGYLGDWTDRACNSNVEENRLTAYLSMSGYSQTQINRAFDTLRREANNHSRNLYGNNQAVYHLLRYGVPVKTEAGKVTSAEYHACVLVAAAGLSLVGRANDGDDRQAIPPVAAASRRAGRLARHNRTDHAGDRRALAVGISRGLCGAAGGATRRVDESAGAPLVTGLDIAIPSVYAAEC